MGTDRQTDMKTDRQTDTKEESYSPLRLQTGREFLTAEIMIGKLFTGVCCLRKESGTYRVLGSYSSWSLFLFFASL